MVLPAAMGPTTKTLAWWGSKSSAAKDSMIDQERQYQCCAALLLPSWETLPRDEYETDEGGASTGGRARERLEASIGRARHHNAIKITHVVRVDAFSRREIFHERPISAVSVLHCCCSRRGSESRRHDSVWISALGGRGITKKITKPISETLPAYTCSDSVPRTKQALVEL